MNVFDRRAGLNRRGFLGRVAVTGAAVVSTAGLRPLPCPASDTSSPADRDRRRLKRWLFWDLWKLDYWDNVDLVQGKPVFDADASYVDPAAPSSGINFPVVHYDSR